MYILVINAGSSSLKYQLIDMDTEAVLAKGLCERIGIEGSNLKQTANGKVYTLAQPMKTHVEALVAVKAALTDAEKGAIGSMAEIGAVGHRVVHGGEQFTDSVLIDDAVIAAVEENQVLAPLHNPACLMGINACREVMPEAPMVAVFDTAFHQTMPRRAYLYGIPYEYYKRLKVRRYGFHGTSHRYVSRRAAEMLGKPLSELKLITCHLGNGSSITAVDGGKSVDTSMGLTPLEGVLMGTRSGSMDPAIIETLMQRDNLTIDQVMSILNKKSGMMGLSGYSDWRDVVASMERGEEAGERAAEVFAYGIRKYIGAYAAAMGGVDAIVFTAGIGENDYFARHMICQDLEWLGTKLDETKNNIRGVEAFINTDDSRVKIMVVPTNEELAIARDTLALL